MFTCLNLYTEGKYQKEKSTSPKLFPQNSFHFIVHHHIAEEKDSKDHVYSCRNCQTCLSKCLVMFGHVESANQTPHLVCAYNIILQSTKNVSLI